MKKRTALFLFLCLTFIGANISLSSVTISADTYPPPWPYQIQLDNGNRIFYMTPLGQENATQLKSGLYYNTDPPVNIYYIHAYYYRGSPFSLILSDDGLYFVYLPWCSLSESYVEGIYTRYPDGQVIGFYKNGLLVKGYTAGDLLEDLGKIQFSTSHFFWEDASEREFFAAKNVLKVTTLDGLVYHFDISTGNILGEDELEAILAGPDVPPPAPYVPPVSSITTVTVTSTATVTNTRTFTSPTTVTAITTATAPVVTTTVTTPSGDTKDSWALINLLLCILGVILAVVGIIRVLLKGNDGPKIGPMWLLIAVILAILGVVVFLLTEDMNLSMVMVDIWTIINAVILIAEGLAVALMFQRRDDGYQGSGNR